MLNGQYVVFNQVTGNIHGDSVFVIKCQVPRKHSRMHRYDDDMLIYDSPRKLLLSISASEGGARALAHEEMDRITLEMGSITKDMMKMYFYAQRQGRTVLVFTSEF